MNHSKPVTLLHPVSIGKKIAIYRNKLNLSQQQLANILGITGQAVSKWECGSTIPNIMTLLMLTKVFGIDLFYELFLSINCTDDSKNVFTNAINVSNKDKLIASKHFCDIADALYHNCTILSSSFISKKIHNAVISKVVLSKNNFTNTMIQGTNFVNTLFVNNNFTNALFANIQLRHCHSKSNIVKSNFVKCRLDCNIFDNEIVKKCEFVECKFTDSSFNHIYVDNVKLSNIKVTKSILYYTTWKECKFKNIDFERCDYFKNQFINCEFDRKSFNSLKHKENRYINPLIL